MKALVGQVATSSTQPVTAAGGGGAAPVVAPTAVPVPAAGVPGGVTSGDLPSIFRSTDLSPIVLLVSILTAAALGAGHALTPGHGKTLMAAYLVGTRGTALHAVGLGLAVTVSHTLGILVLAAIIVGAQGLLSPDAVQRVAPVVAAVTILGIGGWMLAREIRRRLGLAQPVAPVLGHDHHHEHSHDHEPEHADHHSHNAPSELEAHSHGGIRHSHLPAAGSTISWRGLIVLGLAGGLIPSTSALLILLGSIVAGRPVFGFALVIVFGLGMALVMTGVGLAMVFARTRLDRLPSGSGFGRLARLAPLLAAVVVLAFGLYLTAQALGGQPVL